MLSQDVDVALDEITEEVVETAVYSFCCSRDKQAILDRKVAVIMDIDRVMCTSLPSRQRVLTYTYSGSSKLTMVLLRFGVTYQRFVANAR